MKEKVFPIIDDEWRPDQINSKIVVPGLNESQDEIKMSKSAQLFSKERHQLIFYKLSHGKGFVNYIDLLPYLMIFFEVY